MERLEDIKPKIEAALAEAEAVAAAEEEEKAQAPLPLPSVRECDPLLCRLHSFIEALATTLQVPSYQVFTGYGEVSQGEFDRSVLTRLGVGRYFVGAALFRLQNRLRLVERATGRKLTLARIVSSQPLAMRFLELIYALRRQRDAPSAGSRRHWQGVEERHLAWFSKASFGEEVPVIPFDFEPLRAPLWPQTRAEAVREAVEPSDADERGVELAPEERALLEAQAEARLGFVPADTVHARVVFAELCRCLRFGRERGAEEAVAWLKHNHAHPCSCAF